ncbi:fascin-2-like [Branchiostoma lanceolatum]|uniref:Fascin n=1 Tax=Branchiostoma lanceolatum TaxID=7740 RepID=A0A8K0AEJ0_BRALA|nr:FSCN2 [Branchiostoma lanceolatum]
MSTNGVNADILKLSLGLINYKNKYLTAEIFGNKVNVTGNSLKKKQTWTIEQDPEGESVYLRSHLDRFLTSDRHGNVSCDAEEQGKEEKFLIEPYEDGRWAFRSMAHGLYLSGNGENMRCFSKMVGKEELWTVHLAMHPQVNLKNVNRKRYARWSEEDEELRVDMNHPWGDDALITLEFRDGKYAIKTCNNKYLHRDGRLVDDSSEDTDFTLEFRSGKIALKDRMGKYLTAVGGTATMMTRNNKPGKDELFVLEDSHPQAVFVANNGRLVSVRQGVDVAANQDFDEERGESDLETFQMEIDKESGKWSVRTNNDKFWTLKTGGNSGLQATGSQSASLDAQFEIHWLGRQIAFQASNGRFVATKLNGQLAATADEISDACKFTFKLVNRPLLVLRGSHGFVAVGKGDRLECHHADYGIFEMINNDGAYQLKGQDGKFWKMEGENNVAMSSEGGTDFLIELREHSKFCIRAPNDKYLRGEQNGQFRATGTEVNKDTLWEY